MKVAFGLTALAAAALLAACGGGGSEGGTTPPPQNGGETTPPPTQTVDKPTVTQLAVTPSGMVDSSPTEAVGTVAFGGGKPTSAVATATPLTCGTNIITVTPSPVSTDGGTFRLTFSPVPPAGSTCTGKVALSATNSGGSATAEAPVSFAVKSAVLRYTNVVYGNTGDTFPIRFTGTSCSTMKPEIATNSSGFPVMMNGWMYNRPLPSGRVLVAAQMPSDNLNRHAVVLDPPNNVVSSYTGDEGPVPNMDFRGPDPGWVDVSASWPDPDPNNTIGKYVETSTFMVYVSRFDSSAVYCKDKATGIVTKVPGQDLNVQYKAFMLYSN